jgi:hypothetical protein
MPHAHEKLRRIDDQLWCLESHFTRWGCKGSLRMSVIGTSAGLLLYSPVHLSESVVAELKQLGTVTTIIAPNLFHHMYLRDCIATFPKARVLVPPGLGAKIGPLPNAEEFTAKTSLGQHGDFDHFTFAGHALQETIIFHRPTATLITADMIYNYGPKQYPAERLFFRAIGCYGAPDIAFYHRWAITDKPSVKALVQKVSSWDVRRIIMSHGEIIETDEASSVFAKAWSRYAAN